MRGVLLFAFNNGKTDYFEMAVRTAKRVDKFLKLPITVITDSNTVIENYEDVFDSIIITDSDKSNTKENTLWINKGRHKAYELTPYTETLVLDTDYLINSDMLLAPFEMLDDFMCHNSTNFIMVDNPAQEPVSLSFINTAWATVIYFRKTPRTKQIFDCMQMIQDNYIHYVNIFNIPSLMYRNDYSLTIALWIVNGHVLNKSDYIPWNLLHLNNRVKAKRVTDTAYVFFDDKNRYIKTDNVDFHILDKENFMELTNE